MGVSKPPRVRDHARVVGPAPCAFGSAELQEMPDHTLTGDPGATAGLVVGCRFNSRSNEASTQAASDG